MKLFHFLEGVQDYSNELGSTILYLTNIARRLQATRETRPYVHSVGQKIQN